MMKMKMSELKQLKKIMKLFCLIRCKMAHIDYVDKKVKIIAQF